ncbi:hypothetical protein FXO38_04539 [Capsicum annuum]|nr:hypothetical protein FXO38_04539 [Capsicum annuum]
MRHYRGGSLKIDYCELGRLRDVEPLWCPLGNAILASGATRRYRAEILESDKWHVQHVISIPMYLSIQLVSFEDECSQEGYIVISGEFQNFRTSFEICLDDQNSEPIRSGRITLAIALSPSTHHISNRIEFINAV